MATAVDEIRSAALRWIAGLDDAQRTRATFRFDDAERFVWAYTPEPPRRGLALGEMDPGGRAAATELIAASVSSRTAAEIAGVIALETVLGAIERSAGQPGWERRDPGRYWLAVFGDPGSSGPWSWRVGGHHVAIQITVAGDAVVGTTPSFLGANPAVVPGGPLAGTRTLAGEEALARELLAALTDAERAVAVVDGVAPADILTGTGRHADVRSVPVGIRYADVAGGGRASLERLIRHYVSRIRPDVADETWDRLVARNLDAITFAWSGPEAPGRGHYYAVRGSDFVIEYDNTQNGANHIHAVWRELGNDWGEDLLARHLAQAHRIG